MPAAPSVHDIRVATDPTASEYAIVVSMYEVYNDRIFDLLARPVGAANTGANGPSTPNTLSIHHHNIHHSYLNSNNHAHNQRRRPLLFKSTEASPDRKVVAGLRKVICSSLEEALTILETGLLTRKVAGTGSNAASSRGHGFFVVEVKRRRSAASAWKTGTLTVVDLAGSERARNAKTAGATLAEAGKINESLMYLGQCMQMQSGYQACQDGNVVSGGGGGGGGGRNVVVPFRQCKLTELLFSNSFVPASGASAYNNHHAGYRASHYGGLHHHHHHQHQHQHQQRVPQRAIMIVTADARGDFNATSQILRYSALAREVTIPRIPSITSVISQGGGRTSPTDIAYPQLSGARSDDGAPDQRNINSLANTLPATAIATATETETETVLDLRTHLSSETARRHATEDELAQTQARLYATEDRLAQAEDGLFAVQERVLAAEQTVRDEMYVLMEEAVLAERRRWKAVWDEQLERQDEKLDRKIDILGRGGGGGGGVGIDVFEDEGGDGDGHGIGCVDDGVKDLNNSGVDGSGVSEVREHQERLCALEQENEGLKVKVRAMERAAVNDGPQRGQRTPSRKQRVLTTRRWEADCGFGSP